MCWHCWVNIYRYIFTGGNFERVLTSKGIEILEFESYDGYLRATWWRKVWDRISIPISIAAILVSAYVGWFKPEKDTFKDYGEPKLEQLRTELRQFSTDLNTLKSQPPPPQIQTVFYVDTSGVSRKH